MKFRTVVLSALILAASVLVQAKVSPSRPFFLDRDITVNGANVPQGMYMLSLETEGNSVRATLWRERRFIATVHGTWVGHSVKYKETAVLLRVNPDGTRSLVEIRLAGSAKTIVIENENPVLRVAPTPDAGGNSSKTTTN